MTYKLDQKTLSDLMEAPIEIVDRTKLPYERMFARAGDEVEFTPRQLDRRVQAIKSQCPLMYANDHRYPYSLVAPAESATAFCVWESEEKKSKSRVGVSEMAPGLEKVYNDLSYGCAPRISKSILVEGSPYLSKKAFWNIFLGVSVRCARPVIMKVLDLLHELGHSVFPIQGRNRIERSYHRDFFADCWSFGAARYFGIPDVAVDDARHARHLRALIGVVHTSYYIGPAIEAYYEQKPIPSFHTAFMAVRELQHRVYLGTRGTECRHMAIEDLKEIRKDGGEVYRPSRDIFGYEFALLPAQQVVSELKKQMDGCRYLDDFTRKVGEDMLKAFAHFCPKEAAEILSPTFYSLPSRGAAQGQKRTSMAPSS